MNRDKFYRYMSAPELLDDRSLEELSAVLEEYPYFQTARMLYLKNLNNQGNISYDRELRHSAVWITDRTKLFFLLDKRVLLPIDENYNQSVAKPTDNNETIDFNELSDVTGFEKQTKEDDELEQLIMSGSTHTSTFFDVDENIDFDEFKKSFGKKDKKKPKKKEIKTDRKKKLIDDFITKQPKIPSPITIPDKPLPENAKQENTEPEMFSDTLAKIYVKQEKYDKAIAAYEKLSLKYPEKNTYFAEQIKKIKELINNQ